MLFSAGDAIQERCLGSAADATMWPTGVLKPPTANATVQPTGVLKRPVANATMWPSGVLKPPAADATVWPRGTLKRMATTSPESPQPKRAEPDSGAHSLPFGKHKGAAISDVPAPYLIGLCC